MAERRMFTQKIIDSDAFLDMPLSSQALYFHLNMRADDDGFVNNPKKIQRMIAASEDDLKLLIAKRFILSFENGVVVIKHWRMHNLLRKDRYNPTQYVAQKNTLQIKENGAYTEKTLELPEGTMTTARQPSDNQTATQDRKGKDSIVQYSEEKGNIEDTCQQIADIFNALCPSLPSVRTLSQTRIEKLKTLLNTYSLDDFRELFVTAEDSDFLKGKNARNWTATFDWLIEDQNIPKVLEGNYDNEDEFSVIDRVLLERSAAERLEQKKENTSKTIAEDESVRQRAEALKEILKG